MWNETAATQAKDSIQQQFTPKKTVKRWELPKLLRYISSNKGLYKSVTLDEMKQEKIQRKKDELDKKECKRLYFKLLTEIKKDIGICEVTKKEKLQLKSWNKPPPMMKMSSLLTKRKHSSRVGTAFPKMFSNHILK